MTNAEGARPLEGIRVVDAATFIAAPFCATLLAEFGAEVIKVELPGVGDPLRRFGTRTECGETLPWLSESRNKRSVTLDLRKPEGAELFKRLIGESDVLCENFQTGTLEGWGVGWEVLREVNPGLVMLRVTGYGQTGPYAGRPGFGRIANAFGGLAFLAGYPDRPPVTPGSATLPDYMSGLFGAFGVLLALRARDSSGTGQYIDIGLYESIFRVLDELAPRYDLTGFVRQRMGPGTVNTVPHSHYPTKDDSWIAIACTSDKIFARLAVLMGQGELAGEGRFGTIDRRQTAREEVDALVTAWTRERNRDEILTLCEAAQVPCGPIYGIDEIFEDPHFAARGNIDFVEDERIGKLAFPNVVPRLSATPGGIDRLGPPLGEAVDDVYGRILGLAEDEIAALREKGVI